MTTFTPLSTSSPQAVKSHVSGSSPQRSYAGYARPDSDLFLKRSAPYYHAAFFSSNSKRVAPLRAPRDPEFAELRDLLSPDAPHIDFEAMRTCAHDARSTLTQAHDSLEGEFSNGRSDLRADVAFLSQQLDRTLRLEQEASDNLHLLMRV